jgi:peptidylprolyl isomerase
MKVVLISLLVLLIALSGCTTIESKNQAGESNLLDVKVVRTKDFVTLYYKGTFDDGEVFDQTSEGKPAVFQVGVGQLIPGFEQGLLGMKKGQKDTIYVPASLAYGEIDPNKIITVDSQQLLDANIPLQVGLVVDSSIGNGKIIEVDEENKKVTLNYNHPLAGKNLTFEVEILSISQTKPQ